MYKSIPLISLVLILLPFCGSSQTLEELNEKRYGLTQKGMIVLGSWAITNITLSPILANQASGANKYFHQMNGYWNGVNLLIAGFGYFTARQANAKELSLTESLKAQRRLERALLFNTGLDLAYIVSGLYLQERSESTQTNADRLDGFGRSLVLQGAFLFAFDLTFYLFQKKYGDKLLRLVDALAIGPAGVKLSWKL
ncbi:MAG: hypothetical protein AAGF85_11790 [Bacteroidota bacterium]